MGTVLIENPEGNASTGCFGAGKQFGAEGVPLIITVHLVGWTPAGMFEESDRLELQTPKQLYQTTNPLHWHAISDLWHWHLLFTAGLTQFWLTKQPIPVYAFRSLMNGPCLLSVENDLTVFNIVVTLGGVANITFSQVFVE